MKNKKKTVKKTRLNRGREESEIEKNRMKEGRAAKRVGKNSSCK